MREMKDSGVEWLGEVPAGWRVTPVKHLFFISKVIAGKTGYDVLSITQHGLKVKDIKSGEGQLAADYSHYQIVEPGDFAMNHMDLLTGWIDLSDMTGVTSPDYRVFKSRIGEMNKRYYLRVFQHCYSARVFYGLCKGVSSKGRYRLPADAFNALRIPVPPLDEQLRIADYLDEKCAEIDRAVSAAEQSIEEYRAYKNSVVFQAVTKGLDSDVLMADSGLDWVGYAPKHWDVLEQKWLMRKKKSICENWQGESVLSLTTGGVIVRDVESGKGKFPATFDGYQYIDAGNLVLCLFDVDVTPRCVGLAKQAGVISPAYSQFVMLPGAEARFYDYYFRAMDDRKLYLGLTSTMRHSFTADAFGLIHALRPPVDEQLRIANYLDVKTAEIDRLVLSKQAIIADLKAYKQSFIYEVVTGKREV